MSRRLVPTRELPERDYVGGLVIVMVFAGLGAAFGLLAMLFGF